MNAAPSGTQTDTASGEQLEALLGTCHQILRVLTGVMIAAFVLIILLTTASTGPFVQVAGRGLYFVILACAVISLVTWVVRLRTERRIGRETNVAADILKKI